MTTPTPALAASRRGRAERWVSGVTVTVAVTAVVATGGTATVLATAATAQSGAGSSAGTAGALGQQPGALGGANHSRSQGSTLQQWFGQGTAPGSGGGKTSSAGTTGS